MRSGERFVKVLINGAEWVETWGLYQSEVNSFRPIWSEDMPAVKAEFGSLPDGLLPSEIDYVIDAEDVDTPDEAWAALAAYRLLGETNND